MTWLKVNLHTHSTISDGNLSPKSVIKRYRDSGYDVVAMTDHRNKAKAYDYPEMDGIIVLEGCEVSTGHHWNYIEGDKEALTIWNHPGRYNDSIWDINRCGKDLVEVTEHGDFYTSDLNSAKIIERAKLPSVITDDSHSWHGVGHAFCLVNKSGRAESVTKDEIIKNLKKGNFAIDKKEL